MNEDVNFLLKMGIFQCHVSFQGHTDIRFLFSASAQEKHLPNTHLVGDFKGFLNLLLPRSWGR